ncbi:hypothetical protein [Orrella marina]|uniref:Uncharacterized protein n=1 Tax=Orrella marina TaxID=2163011 RepID=A0A2R4XGZ6_9BURK|nr:hypothetical protein [Orrella marina]AWB33086.1 hypothetical protein DBV39_04435 [Orrella marina]
MKNSPNRNPQQNTDASLLEPGSTPYVLEPFDTHRARSRRRLVIAVLASVPYTLEFSKLVSDLLHAPKNAHHLVPQALYLAILIVLIGYIPRLFDKRIARKVLAWLGSSGSFVSLASLSSPASAGSLGSRFPVHISKPTLTTMMSRASGVYVTETGHSQDRTPGGLNGFKDDHQEMQPSMPVNKQANQQASQKFRQKINQPINQSADNDPPRSPACSKPADQPRQQPEGQFVVQAHNPESVHPNHNARNEEWSERQWLHLEFLDDVSHQETRETYKSLKSNGAQKPGNTNSRSTGQDQCSAGVSTGVSAFDSTGVSKCDPLIDPQPDQPDPLDHLSEHQRYEGNHRSKSDRRSKGKSTSTKPAHTNDHLETQEALEKVESNALKLLNSILRLAVSVAIRALRGLIK